MKLKNPVGKKVNMWDKEKTIIGIVIVAKINAGQEKSTIDRIRSCSGNSTKDYHSTSGSSTKRMKNFMLLKTGRPFFQGGLRDSQC